MTIYAGTFAAVAASAAQDVFELVCPATNDFVMCLREVRLGQYSDFGDAEAELLSVQIIRGYTTSGSGGSTPTKHPLRPWGVPTSLATLEANNTTVASAGTAEVLIADSFNVMSGWWYRPPADERIFLHGTAAADRRLVVRITVPADAVTLNGTIVWEEAPSLTGK